ncbi:MAG: DNA polymerase Y family protein [Hyphomonadaceae bacterium]
MTGARWLAIYLPRIRTDRLIRAGRGPADDRPLAVYAKEAGAYQLTGVDARASALGLQLAMSLADARAMQPKLEAVEAEPEEDARALDNIAAWCERFTPIVVLDPPESLFLDITGCAHLFGGEEALHNEIVTRLNAQGFAARAAIAPTPGAAWAFSRYGAKPTLSLAERVAAKRRGEGRSDKQAPDQLNAPHPPPPSPQGRGGEEILLGLARLPIEALRLEPEASALMRRLGLKTVGQIAAAPRSSFTARAGAHAMLRLDQALGRASEVLTPRRPAPMVFALRRFLEPIFTTDAILHVAEDLCVDVVQKLELRGTGALRAELVLFGVDGRDRVVPVNVSRPLREVKPLLRLFREKLNIVAENFDAQFGFEAARLDIVRTGPIEERARALVSAEEAAANAEQIGSIVDVLSSRLGAKRVLRPHLHEDHAPERAAGWRVALTSPSRGEVAAQRPEGVRAPVVKTKPHVAQMEAPAGLTPSVALRATDPPSRGSVQRRPIRLFAPAQPIEVMASVPDGPPIRFRWRRVMREVVRAEGPERISGDWRRCEITRDYYRVEDKQGRRYWLYREGLYGEDTPPRWFVHGVFA